MKRKVCLNCLRIFDLILALVFIWIGIMMISSNYGIFAEGFPKEFSDVLPFDSWVIPGVIFIIVFGIGNLVAFVISFLKKDNLQGLSLIMGCIVLLSVMLQVLVVGERYLASDQFIALSIIQISLSAVCWRLSW